MIEQFQFQAKVRKDAEQKAQAVIFKKMALVLEREPLATSTRIDTIFGITGAAKAAPAAFESAPPIAERVPAFTKSLGKPLR